MAKWSIPMGDLAERYEAQMLTISKKIAFETFVRVVMKSPVDTGRFRNNWTFGQAAVTIPATPALPDPSGAASLAEARKVLTVTLPGVWLFSNGLPYAERLEYGWSGQAPHGMVRLSVLEARADIERFKA